MQRASAMPASVTWIAVALATCLAAASAPARELHREWTHYGGSRTGLQYTALSQITRDNVARLEVAWTYRSGELGAGSKRGYAFQANPILVDGSLYLSTGSGIVIALDPADGSERWRFDPDLDRRRHSSEVANRGVSAWRDPVASPDTICALRIYSGTLDGRLFALDGKTGKPCPGFGPDSHIVLSEGVRLRDTDAHDYSITSPPVLVGDTLVSGSAIGDNAAVEMELGIVRGFDARSGEERWRWDPIPRDPAAARALGWQPDQARRTGAANAWAPLAADVERDLVFIPTGSASPDFYGGERQGDNRWANSLVALRASTGEFVWGRQLVHHDVWDYDTTAQPTLVAISRNGASVPAVLITNKTGYIYTFHRETGEPLFAIEEQPVPASDVPGEALSPTQPVPVAPPPVSGQRPLDADDAWGMLYFDRRSCATAMTGRRSEGIFTPPSLQGTILTPGYGGGPNWGGIAFDPQRQVAIVGSNELPTLVTLVERKDLAALRAATSDPMINIAEQAGTPYGMWRQPLLSSIGSPCIAPPWGRLTAIDMQRGEIVWQTSIGTVQDITPAPVPNFAFGTPLMGGAVITGSGLVFIGATMDNYLRALDIESGEVLWEGRLPAGGQATPMSYFLDDTGRQYVVIAAGGHPGFGTQTGDYLVAFALPGQER